eukprot:scaffold287_cov337-Pavlova_lutheri.AAC.200
MASTVRVRTDVVARRKPGGPRGTRTCENETENARGREVSWPSTCSRIQLTRWMRSCTAFFFGGVTRMECFMRM